MSAQKGRPTACYLGGPISACHASIVPLKSSPSIQSARGRNLTVNCPTGSFTIARLPIQPSRPCPVFLHFTGGPPMSYSFQPQQQQYENPYQAFAMPAALAGVNERAEFIKKTYIHLGGAIVGFVLLLAGLFASGIADQICARMWAMPASYLFLLVGFMVVSWIAEKWAFTATSRAGQYAGLSLYVVAEAIFF